MPEIEKDITVSIDFEVFCATCGAGLCGVTKVTGHRYPQLKIDVCPECSKGYESQINALQENIEQLENEIEKLKG